MKLVISNAFEGLFSIHVADQSNRFFIATFDLVDAKDWLHVHVNLTRDEIDTIFDFIQSEDGYEIYIYRNLIKYYDKFNNYKTERKNVDLF